MSIINSHAMSSFLFQKEQVGAAVSAASFIPDSKLIEDIWEKGLDNLKY